MKKKIVRRKPKLRNSNHPIMDLERQKQIKEHFEGMYQAGEKPWVKHGAEPALDDFFRVLSQKYPKAKILDIGCGDGWISIRAVKEGNVVWGIDSSETAIEEAKEAAKAAGVANTIHFQVGDALNLPYEKEFFEAAIDRGLFHHILPANRTLYFQNILKVLKPKSLVYLSVFSTKNPEGIGERFTPELIKELFGQYFRILSASQDPYPTLAPAHLLHFILERTQNSK